MTTIERIRLGDLAARLGCTLHGDPDLEITGVAGVEQAGPTELTFLANPEVRAEGEGHARRGDSGEAAARAPAAGQPGIGESLSRFCARAGFVLPAAAAEAGHSSASVDGCDGRIGEGASVGAFAVVGEHVSSARMRCCIRTW
jgi:UDP-3-O-[3-hydroxymyristoyl] glucosamine N-acyltransferase